MAGIGLKIGVDNEKAFRESIENINRTARTLDAEFKKINSAYAEGNQGASKLAEQSKNLSERLELQKKRLEETSAMLRRATEAKGEDSAAAQSWLREVYNSETALNKTKTALAENDQKLADIKRGYDAAGNEINEFGQVTKTTAERTAELQSALEKTGAGLEKIGKAAAVAFAAVGAAVSAAAAEAVKVGSSFEEGMSTVAAISGATAGELEKLSEKAKATGATTKFTATESAQAMEYMGMAGWKAAQMLDGLDGIVDLAAASNENLGVVSDIVTDSLTAFKLAAGDAGHFVDVLAAAATNSNTNVTMMGDTFRYAAPIAGALGYNIEGTALSIGLMANAGIKATQAGTSLRSILTRLAAPPKDASNAMDALGISLTDTEGQMKPLEQVIIDLRDAFDGLSETQQTSYAAAIAGKNAISGLLAIVGAGADDFDKLRYAIQNADGAAKQMADIRIDNLRGDLTLLGSALEGVGIKVYEKFQKPLRLAVRESTENVGVLYRVLDRPDVSRALDSIAESIGQIIQRASEAAADMIPKLAGALSWFLDHGDTVLTVVAGIGGAIAGYSAASAVVPLLGNLAGAIKAAGSAQAAFNALMAANPYGMIALGIGALAGVAAAITAAAMTSESETGKMLKQVRRLREESDDLSESIRQSAGRFGERMSDMASELDVADKLAGKIEALAGVEDKTARQKGELKLLVDQLNRAIGQTILRYDEENDALDKNAEQIHKTVDARREQLRAQAYEERQLELLREQIDVQEQLKKLAEERDAVQEKMNQKLTDRGKDIKLDIIPEQKALNDLNQEIVEQMTNYHNLSVEIDGYGKKIVDTRVKNDAAKQSFSELDLELMEAAGQWGVTFEEVERAVKLGGMSLAEWVKAQEEAGQREKELEKEREARFDKLAQVTTDAFSKITADSKVSVDEMIKNLEFNRQAVEDWSKNIAVLAERGVNEGLLQTLIDAGPSMAATVAGMVDATDKKLSELSGVYEKSVREAAEAVERSAPRFEASGKALTDALRDGIFKNMHVPDQAINAMAKSMEKEYDRAVEAHSPPRVYVRRGESIPEALAIGVKKGASNARATMEQFGKDMSNATAAGITAGADQMMQAVADVHARIAENQAALAKDVFDKTMAYTKSYSLFDDVTRKEGGVTGKELTDNLWHQTQAMSTWADNMRELSKRGIDEGLLKELRDMGPKAYEEIEALNKMTDQELTTYNDIWVQKLSIAYTEANREIRGLTDMIQGETEKAAERLAAVTGKNAWEIGKEFIQSTANGIKENLGPLGKVLEDVGTFITQGTKNALDMHSPSKVGLGIGANFAQSIGDGFAEAMRKANRIMAQAIPTSFDAPAVGGLTPAGAFGGGGGITVDVQCDLDGRRMTSGIGRRQYDSNQAYARARGVIRRNNGQLTMDS